MKGKRYVTLCIPGREEDGSDAAWFAYDRGDGASRHRSTACASMADAQALARKLNTDPKTKEERADAVN